MKILLSILAWFGLLLITPALIFSYSSSWVIVIDPLKLGADGYAFAAIIGSLGAALALIGGFIGRPRYFWIGATIIGIVYIISFYGAAVYSVSHPRYIIYTLLTLLPGIACLSSGIIMRQSKNS